MPLLTVFKEWRHEVEVYVYTIGPSWKEVNAILQQARHSTKPFAAKRKSMSDTIDRARLGPDGGAANRRLKGRYFNQKMADSCEHVWAP